MLGTGCVNGKTTYGLSKKTAVIRDVTVKLEKVEDWQGIMSHGVMSTPGVVTDGKVAPAGNIPSCGKIEGGLV